jgi:tetratricopeptide (TPR) repeat protein
MLSLGQKVFYSLLPVVLLSVLAGCGGTETKPVTVEEKRPLETNQAQQQASVTNAPQAEKQVAETKLASAEKANAPAVEVIPHKASAEAPIDLVPIPAAPVVVDEPVKPQVSLAPQAPDMPPAVVSQPAAEPAKLMEVPAVPGPNEFVVTVGTKGASHPAYGKGHLMGFIVNGVPGKELVLERGKTYRFDIRTDPKHDVYLSSKDIGWGSAPISKGVEGAYTYKGVMTFTPDSDTPDVVYYACRNHPYMGAAVHVVNAGEKAKIPAASPQAPAMETHGAMTHPEVSEAQVKQRLMFAEMMANSQGSNRVMGSGNAEAKKLLEEAKQSLAGSRAKLLAGALPEALALADTALKRMGEASRMVPSDEVKAQQAVQYQELLAEIADYEASHQKNLARISKTGTPPEGAVYDKAEVANLKALAKASADKGDYVRANADLQQAQQLLTVAIHKMLDSQTIVYDLNFETPADEYEYELKRFTGYEELIPVAIEAKKPTEGSIKLMESFLEKARSRRDEAKERAAKGAYGDAIEMMQQATTTVRRALRMVGVTQ